MILLMQKRSMRVVGVFADVFTCIPTWQGPDKWKLPMYNLIFQVKWRIFFTATYAWTLESTAGPGCVHSIQHGTHSTQIACLVKKIVILANFAGPRATLPTHQQGGGKKCTMAGKGLHTYLWLEISLYILPPPPSFNWSTTTLLCSYG